MKKLILSLFTILLMALVTALTIPFFIPVEDYKKSALEFLQEKTGHHVSIKGDISFTLLPNVALKLEGVQVDNPPGFTSPYLAKIEKLELALQLWPLFSKQVRIDALTLSKPEIWLEENKLGQKNWAMKSSSSASAHSSDKKAGSGAPSFTYDISRIAVEGTTLHLLMKGNNILAQKLDAEWVNQHASVRGDVNYQGALWNVVLDMQNPQDWWQGGQSGLEVSLQQAQTALKFKGEIQAKPQDIIGTVVLKGKLDIEANAPSHLALQTMGAEITAHSVKMNPVDLQWNEVRASGRLSIDWRKKTPHIAGKLEIPEWELAQEERATKVDTSEGKQVSREWDNTPMDLSALRKCSMELGVKIGELVTPEVTFRKVAMLIHNQPGKLLLTVKNAEALAGTVAAKVEINTAAAPTQWRLQSQFERIAAQDALKLVMQNPRLSGEAQGEISLASQGNSLRDLMQQLNGGGKILIPEGTIEGFSLPKLFRNIMPEAGEAESTKNANISLQFVADKGVITVKEGSLRTKEIQAELGGTVDMGNKHVNLRLLPKIAPQFNTENIAAGNAASLLVPLKIIGRFENLSLRPDVKGAVMDALQNPDTAKANVKILKREGEAVIKGLEDQKDTLKEGWKELKKNKSPEALGNLLKSLDQSGLPMPELLNGLKKPEDTAGSADGGAGAGEQPDSGASPDTGGEGAGLPAPSADESRPPALPRN